MKNVLVLQSGGPTAAINATVAGVVERSFISDRVDKVFGALHGILGVINDNVVEISDTLSSTQARINFTHTPGAGLGTCRHKLPEIDSGSKEYDAIFATLKKHNIGYLVCIGGNDSMDTVNKLSKYAKLNNIEGISIMGAPKTIDNDLCCMDHSPGYSSAARYVASTLTEVARDCAGYCTPSVTIVEIMGRHAGWLAAAAALAKDFCGSPHLIYLPEVVFDDNQFISDLKVEIAKYPSVIVAISEGIHYANDRFVSEGHSDEEIALDAFGHKRVSGAAIALEALIAKHIPEMKVRAIELSLLQRAAGTLTSSIDLIESRMLGATAMDRALSGISGQVSVLNRVSSIPYKVKYSSVPVDQVANLEKKFPREWINEAGNDIMPEYLDYIKPLISSEDENRSSNGIPNHVSFLD